MFILVKSEEGYFKVAKLAGAVMVCEIKVQDYFHFHFYDTGC